MSQRMNKPLHVLKSSRPLAFPILAAAALALAGCTDSEPADGATQPKPGAPPVDPMSLPAGQGWQFAAGEWPDARTTFSGTCAQCHVVGIGPELRGRQLPADYLVQVARKGVLAMPAIRPSEISDKELLAMAQWIEKSPAPLKPAAQPSGGGR